MTKRQKTKRQVMVHTTLYRKQNIEQHKFHENINVLKFQNISRTILNGKPKNTILSEHFKHPIEKSQKETKSTHLT